MRAFRGDPRTILEARRPELAPGLASDGEGLAVAWLPPARPAVQFGAFCPGRLRSFVAGMAAVEPGDRPACEQVPRLSAIECSAPAAKRTARLALSDPAWAATTNATVSSRPIGAFAALSGLSQFGRETDARRLAVEAAVATRR
jgi:hypothetical protein